LPLKCSPSKTTNPNIFLLKTTYKPTKIQFYSSFTIVVSPFNADNPLFINVKQPFNGDDLRINTEA